MKVDLLDFSSPNVGYEDNEGKDLCSCCRTYYVVSPEELAEAKEAVSDLYEALRYLVDDLAGWVTHQKEYLEEARKALAKVEGNESSCREHWLNTMLGKAILEGD